MDGLIKTINDGFRDHSLILGKKSWTGKNKRLNDTATENDNASSSSASSRLSTKEIELIVEKLRLQSHRNSTRRNYTIWKLLSKFYLRLDIKPCTWEDRLVLFVGYLVNNNKQSSTIKSYISAIKYVLKEDKVELNENKFLIDSLTKACKLINDTVDRKLPIQKSLLQAILTKIKMFYETGENNQPYLSIMYRAIFSTAYYGLLRVGEVTKGDHPILARDVHVAENKNKMLLVLRMSKTHWKNDKPQIVKISSDHARTINNQFCPFRLLRKFASLRGPYTGLDELFFTFSDGTPVTPAHMHTCLKTMLKLLKIDHTFYTFHGLRLG